MANEALYFFDTTGASHLNDCIAFSEVSLYAALWELETREFTTIDAEDAFFGVEAEVVLS